MSPLSANRLRISDLVVDNNIECQFCKQIFRANKFAAHLRNDHESTYPLYYLQFVGTNNCLCGCGNTTGWDKNCKTFFNYCHGHNIKGHTKNTHPALARRSKIQLEKVENGTYIRPDQRLTDEQKNERRQKACITRRKHLLTGKILLPNMYRTHEQRCESGRKAHLTKINNGHNIHSSYGRRGHYLANDGSHQYFMSLLEYEWMIKLDSDLTVRSWSRCKDVIPYFDEEQNKLRSYYPDFSVTLKSGDKEVHETKGYFGKNAKSKQNAAIVFYEKLRIKYRVLNYQCIEIL